MAKWTFNEKNKLKTKDQTPHKVVCVSVCVSVWYLFAEAFGTLKGLTQFVLICFNLFYFFVCLFVYIQHFVNPGLMLKYHKVWCLWALNMPLEVIT